MKLFELLKRKDLEEVSDYKESVYEEALRKCKNNEEIYKKIKEFPFYEVSNLGNARKKLKNGRYRSLGYVDIGDGIRKVSLQNSKTVKKTTIASLMAKVFEIPNPENKKCIRRIDGNILNDRLDNLSYEISLTEIKERNMKLRCNSCGDEIEGDKKGTYIECSCGKTAIDETPDYIRVIGNEGDYEEVEEEYSDRKRIDNELMNKKIEPLNNEIWKWVVGYERWYEVSNLGNVRKVNQDGTRKLLIASSNMRRGRCANLHIPNKKQKVVLISHLVADAFNLPLHPTNKRSIYHIDGDINNDCLTNLTYDETETDEYKKNNEPEKQEKDNLQKAIEENKEFLEKAKEINSSREITLRDIYDKLNEILEVLKK